jgi:hypothetical protein
MEAAWFMRLIWAVVIALWRPPYQKRRGFRNLGAQLKCDRRSDDLPARVTPVLIQLAGKQPVLNKLAGILAPRIIRRCRYGLPPVRLSETIFIPTGEWSSGRAHGVLRL